MGKRERVNEEGILERIRGALEERGGGRRSAGRSRFVSLGIGDDAALLQPTPGYETILTCDWFLEGTHFLRDEKSADAVGWKCLARAVSDVAAMGGVPRCFLLSLALPKELSGAWLNEFLNGLRRASRRFRCLLAGGDTTERSKVLINITAVGELRRGLALRREGAQAGDVIYVSGRLGEAELGLRLLCDREDRINRQDERLRKHFYPEPRLALGQWLAQKRMATAMMDLSDGLSSDLRRMCEASGVGAAIRAKQLPLTRFDTSGVREADAVQMALHGGDDYELLFTVPRKRAAKLPREVTGVRITAVGEITKERGVRLVDERGGSTELQPEGWDAFRLKL